MPAKVIYLRDVAARHRMKAIAVRNRAQISGQLRGKLAREAEQLEALAQCIEQIGRGAYARSD